MASPPGWWRSLGLGRAIGVMSLGRWSMLETVVVDVPGTWWLASWDVVAVS